MPFPCPRSAVVCWAGLVPAGSAGAFSDFAPAAEAGAGDWGGVRVALTVPGFLSVITGVNPGFDGSAYHCAMTDTMHSGGTSKLLGAVLAKEEESSKRMGEGTTSRERSSRNPSREREIHFRSTKMHAQM